ncbi:hypothetical protein IV203_012781 [Nitzschia inconspicua]|uniref:Uncharacterized protein n=1 Tax=Nitzschia inconspicua TaxID=303405 RepID=A0A9K3M5W8_9STRA|nr:hypothetical protein IV203_012769 [Nitzschia inconspicua]KAG7350052.1 hypothetical protein IV203_012649 [Nitzschia inconspicua]KAG7373686.1 hypothetical protein IV203_012781 [Nitzschia inconspicua]
MQNVKLTVNQKCTATAAVTQPSDLSHKSNGFPYQCSNSKSHSQPKGYPTNAPTPSPTNSPTLAPNSYVCSHANSPVSFFFGKCGTDLNCCANVVTSISSNSMNGISTDVPLNDAKCAQMNNVRLGQKCLLVPPVSHAKDLSHKGCNNSLNPLIASKFDGSCDRCSGFAPVPGTS